MSEEFVPTDAMSAAAGYVSREFGSYGYSVRVIRAGSMNSLFELRASDGSRRLFLVDRYGNVELAPLEIPEFRDEYANECWQWCSEAANTLYERRNGFAVELAS